MICCVCVGLEVHIRHEHSCNGSRIDTVCLRLTKAEAFAVKVGVQRIDDRGGHTFVKQKSEDVVAVVSGCLKPYFYFVLRAGTAADCLEESVEPLCIVWNGEHICQNFTFRTEDEAIMLVLSNIDSNTNHDDTSNRLFDAGSTGHFTLVTLFHINRLAVSN